jgi:phospholipid/cholesterol/gamma-HCH transport system substrate-binding protein
MPKEPLMKVVKRRLLGLTFLVVIAGLVSLSIAIYNKVFTPTVNVTLKAQHTGNELLLDSDVKVRGILVGSVKAVRADGSNADVTLALSPSWVDKIPSNVRAVILPKTLFGEQYVDLRFPPDPQGHLASGDVIPEDHSKGALETETVLGNLLPLLTAVQPAELNDTLNAIATALHGRGVELGHTLVNFDKYLHVLNPHTQQMIDDLHKLGQVSLEYNGLAPDIFASLKNLQTSATTVIQRQQGFDSLLRTGASTSNILSGFLAANQQRLIDVTGQTAKTYKLLANYSSEFPCMFEGISDLAKRANQAIYNREIHLRLTLDKSSIGPYRVGTQPTFVTGYGPDCFGLPNPPVPFYIPKKFRCLNDGAPLTDAPCAGPPGGPGHRKRKKSGTSTQTASETPLNSPAETAIVNTLVGQKLGIKPDKVPYGDTLLAAPLLRGTRVVIK